MKEGNRGVHVADVQGKFVQLGKERNSAFCLTIILLFHSWLTAANAMVYKMDSRQVRGFSGCAAPRLTHLHWIISAGGRWEMTDHCRKGRRGMHSPVTGGCRPHTVSEQLMRASHANALLQQGRIK